MNDSQKPANDPKNPPSDEGTHSAPRVSQDVTQTTSSSPKRIAQRFRETQHPTRVGPYKILERLGEGGMGVVYLAEQTKPVHRRVALKVIKLGMDTKQTLARFETEREALAVMNHPNVAKVFDAGATEEGRPYFVMEHVPGIRITDYCDKHRLSTEERLKLFMDVCHAIQHAHQKGIIHRDIKPSNILVTVQDDQPVPKIIDFGVAKATEHKLTERTLFTEQGQLVGTPGYMSPEQAEMTALDIDTRSDIYSLGVVLYEMLVGNRPFDEKRLRGVALTEIQRVLREEDPPKPSTRLSALQSDTPPSETHPSGSAQYEPGAQATGPKTRPSGCAQYEPEPQYEPGAQATGPKTRPSGRAQYEPEAQATGHVPLPYGRVSDHGGVSDGRGSDKTPVPHGRVSDRDHGSKNGRGSVQEIAHRRRTEPKTLIRTLRGDLDWIVMKCLEKDRTRRYETANGLALELQRYLNHEPVLAGPPGATYRFKKFVRRNRSVVTAAVVVLAVLLAGVTGTTWQAAVATRQRDRAVHAERLQRRAREEAENARDEAEAVTNFLTDTLAAVDPRKQGKDVPLREVLDRAAENIGDKFADQPLIEARLRSTIGRTYSGLGLYDKAEDHLVDAAALYRREKGPHNPDTLNALNVLANVLGDRGDYTAAAAQHKAVLEVQRRVLGPEHPSTLLSMNNLAGALDSQGKYAEAEALHRKTLEIKRRVLGEERPSTLASMNNLARSLNRQGRYAEAEALHRKTLEIKRRVLGEERPETLRSMNGLANALDRQGKYAEAEVLHRKHLEIERRVLGEEHPNTLASMDNLAIALWRQGKYAEAEVLHRKHLEIERRVLGEEHPNTLASMDNLGIALCRQGKYAEAEALHQKTLNIQRRVLGTEHPDTLGSMNNLALALADQGKYTEAEELYRKTLEIQRRVLGAEHPSTLASMGGLAVALDSQGRYAEAEKLYRKTLEVQRRVLGAEHPDTLSSMNNLANGLRAQSKHAEAEELHRKTLEVQRRVLGAEHPNTLLSMNNLAGALDSQGRYAEAEKLYRKTLEIRRRVLGEEHPHTLVVMNHLAEVLSKTGQTAESESLYREAIQRYRTRAERERASVVDLDSYSSLLLTCKVESLRDPAAALAPAKKAVEMTDAKNYDMLDTLALAYQMTGHVDEAVETQRKALALLPSDPTPTRTELEGRLGEYLVEQGTYAEAEALLVGAYEAMVTFRSPARFALASRTRTNFPARTDRSARTNSSGSTNLPARTNPASRTRTDGEARGDVADVLPDDLKEAIGRLVKLYDAWHAAEPGKGYDKKAAEWRAKLESNQ